MKTLYDLVLQYKSDVEQRIECLKEEWNNQNEDCIDDCDQQIVHWETTLKEINDVLESIPEQTNEMRVLREFVEEFSPVHQTLVEKMDYDELFGVVRDIVGTHYEEDI